MIIGILQSFSRVSYADGTLLNINSFELSDKQQPGSIPVRREAPGPAPGPLPRGRQYGHQCLQRNNQAAAGRRDFDTGCNAGRK